MNEIEKMYKNAGVERTPAGAHCLRYWYNTCVLSGKECKKKNKQKCKDFKGRFIDEKYPTFTAEKQLKLIDWFIRNEADIQIDFDYEDELYCLKTYDDKTIACKSFTEALAGLINIYFEGFTDGEIEEIKEVLE